MGMIGLYGKLTAHPGQRNALVEHLLRAAELIKSARGCRLWVVSTSAAEPEAVWVTELWESEADHDASLSLPGVREHIQQVMPLLTVRPERIDLRPVGGIGIDGP